MLRGDDFAGEDVGHLCSLDGAEWKVFDGGGAPAELGDLAAERVDS